MNLDILEDVTIEPNDYELIERKGYGHPDTLADALAEVLSQVYANYTREKFGVILHHNFDKVGLLGGKSYVAFGKGHLVSPIRVLLNGRATTSFGSQSIPVADLLEQRSRCFLKEKLPLINPESGLEFHHNTSTGSSPGHVETGRKIPAQRGSWFSPDNLGDVRERSYLASNDTSVGCGYWPLTSTEQLVHALEHELNSSDFHCSRPWLGTDIKVMACRIRNFVDLTVCIPQIAGFVSDCEEYTTHLDEMRELILKRIEERMPSVKSRLALNTKDNFEIPELYLTAIGSSIETGDEGLVGRGNRPNGLISMCRPYSMEGACGKNPVYHVGKLYGIVATNAARLISEQFGLPVIVWLVSQEGRLLSDPWRAVTVSTKVLPKQDVQRILADSLSRLPQITESLLGGKIELF